VQVFTNLISNAIKYTPKGSVSVQAEEKDFAVMVRVRDTGVGLSAEEQARLFDKFYRTRSGVDSGETGNGLGLAIVRGLVEAHGGTIRVESEPGRGSVFTVTLPTVGA
jgi:signal transduction histidine kinase